MSSQRYIHNVSGGEKYYQGSPVADAAFFLIPLDKWPNYATDDTLLADIVLGDVFISKDGINDIVEGISAQTDYLKGIYKDDKTDTSGNKLVALMKPTGLSDGTLVTTDFCDKTTWYQGATSHNNATLGNTTGFTYKHASLSHWIDLTHGKLYGEDSLTNKMIPVIYDNGVEVPDSDYTIDYSLGEVTFTSAPTGPVTADFYTAGSSVFTIAPTAGKRLSLEHSELQFAEDVKMNSPINFEIWVYNPADLPNKFKYRSIRYKNIKDLINAANLGQGYIPKLWPLTQNVIVMPFNYIATKPLESSVGAELRISVDNDVEYEGEFATATFYFLSEDE
jgi:hypothetical protein